MKQALFLALAATLAGPACAQPTDRQAIEQALEASAAAWSRGDLAGYMKVYENAPGTTYIGRNGLVTGIAAITAHYAQAYPAGSGHSMGSLTLATLQYAPLGPDNVLVTGRFALARASKDGGDAKGIYTVLMHRSAQGWHIAYDHSS